MKHTEETNKKIRDSKGRFIKGHVSIDGGKTRFKKGHKWNKEIQEKVRMSRLGNKSTLGRTGELANNWQGGKTQEYRRLRSRRDWKLWREAVYQRDSYTCQKCNDRGVHLHPHHILNQHNHQDLVFDLDNGITLCKDCHYDFHSKYGFKNNDCNQIKEFLKGDK